ncbi:MAG: glycerophosphodiester phosphodiesterase [Gemmatimonadaceae bacterium]
MPELIAHRGMPRLARENTLASFELALQAGADAIELDAHVSADATVVVHHDPRVAGENGRWLSQLEASELARGGIPTLDEVCELVGDRVVLYVEAKAPSSAAAIVECLTAHQVRAAVHSLDQRIIQAIRATAPSLPIGLLVPNAVPDAAAVARAQGVRDLWPTREIIDARFVESAHAIGSRVIAWTVNDANDARRLRELGVDGLCTDDVRMLRTALGVQG